MLNKEMFHYSNNPNSKEWLWCVVILWAQITSIASSAWVCFMSRVAAFCFYRVVFHPLFPANAATSDITVTCTLQNCFQTLLTLPTSYPPASIFFLTLQCTVLPTGKVSEQSDMKKITPKSTITAPQTFDSTLFTYLTRREYSTLEGKKKNGR